MYANEIKERDGGMLWADLEARGERGGGRDNSLAGARMNSSIETAAMWPRSSTNITI